MFCPCRWFSSSQSEPALLRCLCEVDDLPSLLLQPAIDRANLHDYIRPVMGSALTCYYPLGSFICAPSTRASLTVLPGQGGRPAFLNAAASDGAKLALLFSGLRVSSLNYHRYRGDGGEGITPTSMPPRGQLSSALAGSRLAHLHPNHLSQLCRVVQVRYRPILLSTSSSERQG